MLHLRLGQSLADFGAHVAEALLDDRLHVDLEQQVGAALKIETEVDTGLRKPAR
jgi:hypothetical protein